MTAIRQPGLFRAPGRAGDPILSRTLARRLDLGRGTYSAYKGKDQCQECLAVKYETERANRSRALARGADEVSASQAGVTAVRDLLVHPARWTRRVDGMPRDTDLRLCAGHTDLWRKLDASPARRPARRR